MRPVQPGDDTCWTVIRAAAAGDAAARESFGRAYLPVVRAYLAARWSRTRFAGEIEDATQEVFLDCFKENGALVRAEPGRAGGFHGYLYGVVRNIALRVETRAAKRRAAGDEALEEVAGDDTSLSCVFDREWARSIMRAAAERQAEAARRDGAEALRRVELLRLRFHEDLPIRAIAAAWGADPAHVHHEYARAREEFRRALLAEIAFHHPGTPRDVEEECSRLLGALP